MSNELSGRAQTVLGCVDPSTLGHTQTHEHLSLVYECAYYPARPEDKHRETLPFSLENLGWIRQYPYSHRPNLIMNDEYDAITEEMKLYKKTGGGTIVENTTKGIGRDMKFMKRVAEETGVNVVAGSGYYEESSLPAGSLNNVTEEQLVSEMTNDILHGCDGTDIRCGVIGEVASVWPITANEKKVLRATAAAQAAVGCGVIIHPGRHWEAPFEICRILQEAGGDVRKTVMSHLDRTIEDYGKLAEFAATGMLCEYDLFGVEVSFYQRCPTFDMPSDAERINRIIHLVKEGYGDQVVIGHDVHTRHRLMKYGGHGYCHILKNVVPKMRAKGMSEEVINKILVENPKRWLTFK